MLFGIAEIHAHEHLCPVLCFGSSGAGVDFQYACHGILLFAEHVFQFQRLNGIEGFCVAFVHFLFADHLVAVEFQREFHLFGECADLVVSVDPFFEAFDEFHLFFGTFAVVPEFRVLRTELFLLVLHDFGVDVEVAVQLRYTFL